MAEMFCVNEWLDGKAIVSGEVEKIFPGRHVRQNQWQSKWNEEYLTAKNKHCYDYISDYQCIFKHPIEFWRNFYYDKNRWKKLQAAKEEGTSVPITNLAHFTNPEAATRIVDSGGFRGRKKKISEDEDGNDVKARFSWWSPVFIADETTKVRLHLKKVIQPFLDEGNDEDQQDTLHKQFATSDAFRPKSWRHGNVLFLYGIDELCQYYRDQVDDEVQFKVLGTFGYKKEVMHAVLVCSQANGTQRFAAYPNVLTPVEDVKNEAVITCDDDGNWVWKPQETGGEIERLQAHWQPFPRYRRWENVAFAFHIPDEWRFKGKMADNPGAHKRILGMWSSDDYDDDGGDGDGGGGDDGDDDDTDGGWLWSPGSITQLNWAK